MYGYGWYFVWNFKGSLWNSTQNIYPYIERYIFDWNAKNLEKKQKKLLDLWAHKHFSKGPQSSQSTMS